MTNLSPNKSKPRILISGHLPPPMGGIATYCQSLLNSSLPEQVDLLFVETSSQKRTLSQTGSLSFSNLIWALEDCIRFAKAVIKHRPQVTHIATAFGLSFVKHSVCVIIARLAGSRVLLHHHCSIVAMYMDRPWWWKWYVRQIIRLTNGVIALSKEWQQLTTIIPGCKVYDLPNAIDLSAYRAIAQKRKDGEKNPLPLKVLYLGYLGRNKGTFELLDAAKEIAAKETPIFFDLVGEELSGGEKEELKQKIIQDGLDNIVTLHPPVAGDAKNDFFQKADIFAYPSYSEGMPMAVIEAMACGLPIIATRVGGLPDLVSDGINGILVDAGNPGQIASALELLSANSEMRLSMGAESSQTAGDKFDMEKLVPRLVSIYQKALTGA
jgi:glycosyltransferase involved in cell wall biosynthesis